MSCLDPATGHDPDSVIGHDRRVRGVGCVVRLGATSVYDYGDRPVQAFHVPDELRVRELVFVSLAHNEKGDNQT